MSKDASTSGAIELRADDYVSPESEAGEARHIAELQSSEPSWWRDPKVWFLVIAFSLMAVAALLLARFNPPKPDIDLSSTSSATQGTVVAEEPTSPFASAAAAQARRDAQELLEQLLDSKRKLEQLEANQWAQEAFSKAIFNADQGDESYRKQQYELALSRYRAAQDSFDSIFSSISDVIENEFEIAKTAIQKGEAESAVKAYERVLKIRPESITALQGIDRANKLEQVFSLLERANKGLEDFTASHTTQDIEDVSALLDQALAIDAHIEVVNETKTKVELMLKESLYKDAMSKGFAALFKRRNKSARTWFQNALKIRPDDQVAQMAARQSKANRATRSVDSILVAAKQQEVKENWSKAHELYQSALRQDKTLVNAKSGSIRTRARAELDGELSKYLNDMLSLSQKSRRVRAERTLLDAKRIVRKGARLKKQIAGIEAALKSALQPVAVELVSDRETSVTLTKEGARSIRLGRFERKTVSIKPGRYVAVGVRLGYQDVRIEMSVVAAGEKSQAFVVKCERPLSNLSMQNQ